MSVRMRRVWCAAALGLLSLNLAPAALAQGPAAFEVASIHPSAEGPPAPGAAGVQITPQQVRFAYLSLRDYLSIAFKVPVHQIAAPEWINSARFDIMAKLPEGATPDDFAIMVETLLRDRFKLQAHRESRESPVYALGIGRNGSKLVRIPDEAPTGEPFTVTSSGGPEGISADLGQGASLTLTNTRFELKKVTTQIIAETLGRFMDHPVLDYAKLDGRYNVAFDIAPEDYMPLMIRSAVNAGIQLPPQAMQILDTPTKGSVESGLRSLGLSLEATRAPLDHIVVESIERTPTPN